MTAYDDHMDAKPDDDMTCNSCGGTFLRREGDDTPVILCAWCAWGNYVAEYEAEQ